MPAPLATMKTAPVLVFDFGNVVAEFSHARAGEALARFSSDADPGLIRAFCFGSDLDDAFERGRIAPEEFRDRVRKEFGLACPDGEFDKAFSDIFNPVERVTRLVRSLAGRVPLVLLSNTTPIHSRWFLKRMRDDLEAFDHLVMSHDTGHRKPEPGIFAHVERLTGKGPSSHVLIDDLPANVAGARAVGWGGIVAGPGTDLAGEITRLGVVVP